MSATPPHCLYSHPALTASPPTPPSLPLLPPSTLKDHLGLISDAGSLASLLDHAMYAGSSLARVGCDFRPMLEPLFEGRATEVLRAHVAAAAAAFDALFTSHKWAAASGVGGAGSADAGPQGGAAALGRQGSAGSRGADATVAPPQDILEFPFLAALTNGILAGEGAEGVLYCADRHAS